MWGVQGWFRGGQGMGPTSSHLQQNATPSFVIRHPPFLELPKLLDHLLLCSVWGICRFHQWLHHMQRLHNVCAVTGLLLLYKAQSIGLFLIY